MLAMSYDAGLRREELCSLETGDIRSVTPGDPDSFGNNEEPTDARTSLFGDYRASCLAFTFRKGGSQREPRPPLSVRVAKEPWSADIDLELVEGRSRHRKACGREWLLDAHHASSLPNGPCSRRLGYSRDRHFAGHRNIETTMIYIHLSARDLAAKFTATMDQVHQRRLELMKELFQ